MSGYYHADYPRHIIIAVCKAEKMLGLVAMRADIGIDKEYKSGIFFCRFTEDVELSTVSPKQHIHGNVKIGAIMLPFTKANEEFRMKYSVIYSDWDILRSNGVKDLPEITYDMFDT